MKIYIAGPVSGQPDGNRPLFDETARRLRAAGHSVINPVEATSPEDDQHGPGTPRYEEIMRQCFTDVESCDAICTLTGWQASVGAVEEVRLAERLGKRKGNVDDFVDGDPLVVGSGNLKWMGDPECEPERGYDGDAGFDLYVSEDTTVPFGKFVDVPLGISVELPPGTWAMLTGRSSTIRRRGLLVTQGIIDNGYRGPLYAGVQNLNDTTVRLERGERIAQLILFPLIVPMLEGPLPHLSPSDRGHNGFGSSGA